MSTTQTQAARRYRVRGLVQGVGFRPTVYRIAVELGLSGTVYNDAEGVMVHLEGAPSALDAFAPTLLEQKPPLARIDSIEPEEAPFEGHDGFSIDATPSGGHVTTAITADASICKECLEDIFRPGDRRYRYAFANCTHCGPRFTITRALPYDRPQTSMAAFPMCPDCKHEYDDPLDRRFHAQPVACPECGPSLKSLNADGSVRRGDAIRDTVAAIRAGLIVAIKGLGGFHLVCNAENKDAVQKLRLRKKRDEKPFALMVAGIKSAERLVELTPAQKTVLTSPAHPIVLAKRKHYQHMPELEGVADGLEELGVMLPYTPLHALLFHTFAGEPKGTAWMEEGLPVTLVMTSANLSGEPLIIDNATALHMLSGIADRFLIHDRDIVVRCDDSVVRVADDGALAFVRRARGYAPEAVRLENAADDTPAVLATGPLMKNTATLMRGKDAFVTQHIGTLTNAKTFKTLVDAVTHLEKVFEVKPSVIACDLHPDFASTRLAVQMANSRKLPLYPIAHHAAHVGVVMAEKGRRDATFGLALDGVGLGSDGGIWGGECLLVDGSGFTRVGHLQNLPLPGGDKAAKEPWRMAAAILHVAGRSDQIKTRLAAFKGADLLPRLMQNPRLAPPTSSLGRWFDGASALLDYCYEQHDEATAAMRLEAGAERAKRLYPDALDPIDGAWHVEDNGTLNLKGLAEMIGQAAAPGRASRARLAVLFEATLAAALLDWTLTLRERLIRQGKLSADNKLVALTGGCFLNKTLARTLVKGLKDAGLEPALPASVPPGDGGLSLGQAWLAQSAFMAGQAQHTYFGRAFK